MTARRGRRALRLDAGQADRRGARPAPRRPGCWPRRWPAAELHGVTTNRDLLVRVLRHARVRGPATPTPASWTGTRRSSPRCCGGPARYAWRRWPPRSPARGAPGGRPGAPAAPVRLAQRRPAPQQVTFTAGPTARSRSGTGSTAPAPRRLVDVPARRRGRRTAAPTGGALSPRAPTEVVLDVDGVRSPTPSASAAGLVFVDTRTGRSASPSCRASRRPRRRWPPGRWSRRCPARWAGCVVEVGQRVAAGDLLLTLEAMKLEHPVLAPADGVVSRTAGAGRRQVDTGSRARRGRPRRSHPLRRTHELRPHPRTAAAPRRRGRARQAVRARVLRRQGPKRRAHHRAVERGRPARLPRRQHRPRSTAAAAAASPNWPSSARSWPRPAARCCCSWSPRPSPPRSSAKHGTPDQREPASCPGIADGTPEDRLRHHRAGGRLQLPPARPRWPAATATTGCSPAASASSPASTRRGTCWWWPAPTDAATGKLKPALFLVPADAPGLTAVQAGHGDPVAGEPVPALPRRRPAARRRARRRRWTPGCRRCSPASTRSGSRWPRWAPAPAGTPSSAAIGYTADAQGLGPADRLPPGRVRTRWRTRPSRWSWPG